jgi:hypothetical protein
MNQTYDDPQPPADPERVKVLREAAALITGDRQDDYGPPAENFGRSADLLNIQFAHLLKPGAKFQPHDVAVLMIQMKLSRSVASPKRDTFVDVAGYSALAAELSGPAE